jgi:hypothetical protein
VPVTKINRDAREIAPLEEHALLVCNNETSMQEKERKRERMREKLGVRTPAAATD